MSSTDPRPSDPVQRQAEARAAVAASLSSIGTSLTIDLNARAKDLHSNSQAISKQEKALQKQTAAMAKESAKWEKMADQGLKKLNEVGDIQNWAELLERDLLVLEETARLVDERDRKIAEDGIGRL